MHSSPALRGAPAVPVGGRRDLRQRRYRYDTKVSSNCNNAPVWPLPGATGRPDDISEQEQAQMNKFMLSTAVAAVAMAAALGSAAARDQIQIAGSSTVLPYAKIVAEQFGETFTNFKTPVVESGGSGAGIKEFCKGVGEDTIDIANSSRPIKKDEVQSCVDAGVKEIQEVKIGYDGIVFATDIAGPDWALEPKDVHDALAAKVIKDGKLVDNPYTKWSEVNSKLPDWEI